MNDKIIKVINGNALNELKKIENESVDCVITSPPYYAARNYIGAETEWGNWYGQLGMEPNFNLYLDHLLMITNELKRVLKQSGTLFWNMGDSYAGNMGKRSGWNDNNLSYSREEALVNGTAFYFKANYGNIQQKSLMMLPERFAIKMIDHGWILRNKIIWHKTNGMPSSVKDRFSNKWEYIFFFTKSKKYYFNLNAVRKPLAESSIKRIMSYNDTQFQKGKAHDYPNADNRMGNVLKNMKKKYSVELKTNLPLTLSIEEYNNMDFEKINIKNNYNGKFKNIDKINWGASPGARLSVNGEYYSKQRFYDIDEELELKIINLLRHYRCMKGISAKEIDEYFGYKDTAGHWFRLDEEGRTLPKPEDWYKLKELLNIKETEYDDIMTKEHYVLQTVIPNPNGKNPGDVIHTPALRHKSWYAERPPSHDRKYDSNADGGDFLNIPTRPHTFAHFAVYPDTLIEPLIKAGCPEEGIVLDPFAGSGTTGVVAKRLGMSAILIEISKEYVNIIYKRLGY
jgi:DNA modification methylase